MSQELKSKLMPNLRMAQGTKCLHTIWNYVHEEGEVEISTCVWHKYRT